MKKTADRIRVYMDFMNRFGEVTDTHLIAEFCNKYWAESFVEDAIRYETDALTKIRVEKG